jgi:hypothetical protein
MPELLRACLPALGFGPHNAPKIMPKHQMISDGLYLWNARLGEAFYLPLQTVEVLLRNAIHQALCDAFGMMWQDNAKFRALLSAETVSNIEQVKRRIALGGKPVTTDRVVAGLSFDFWTWLLTSTFDRPIWQTRLRRVFPNLPGDKSRGDMRNMVTDIKNLRNRVAHHEPIIGENLSQRHADIVRLVGFRCHETSAWLRHHSAVQLVMRARP